MIATHRHVYYTRDEGNEDSMSRSFVSKAILN
jgi:hypothetical protein